MNQNDSIKDFSKYADIQDFYSKTGFSPSAAFDFLLKELKKQNNGDAK